MRDSVNAYGGGEKVLADGIDYDEAMLLDAKHVGKLERSPYVPESKFPRERLIKPYEELDSEFRRYGAVISDPQTPVVGLKVITNDPRAAEFLLGVMERWKVPGYVLIQE